MIQAQVLNKIIQSKDASIITLNNLSVDSFSEYKDEFCFIRNHLTKYGNIPDIETVLNNFPDFQVITVNEPVQYLLEELMHDSNKRFLAENYTKVREYILSDRVEDALQILRSASDRSTSYVSMQSVDILRDTSRYDAYIDKVDNLDKYFISTGFDELDNITGGWDVYEELATIVARNGLGKSWILFKCAAAAAKQGKNVGIYSGEMSENKVGYRIDTILGNIANGALVHGGGSIKNEYREYIENLPKNVPGSIRVLTPKMINGPATVTALRAFIEKDNLDILFIDQHSLLEDERGAKSPPEKAANISKDLKLLQVVKRIPIISVSQQNREKLDDGKGNKSFDTTQVAMSDRIAQDSTQIIFIERKDDLMRLHLVKSRDTANGKVLTYRIDLNKGIWQYVPDDQSSEENIQSSGYTEDDVF